MSAPVCELECAVEIGAPREFAWQFWTDVANWGKLEPGVDFELDGPFALGTHGVTKMPGQEPRRWLIRAVDRGYSWSQEMPMPGATFLVSMHFEESAVDRTRITQRLWLEGEGAAAFLDHVRIFETTTADGLKRIAAAIEKAYGEAIDSERS
jgi:hypothetical protein